MIVTIDIFTVFCALCIIALIVGFTDMLYDCYIEYLYIVYVDADIEGAENEIEENEILLDMLYD